MLKTAYRQYQQCAKVQTMLKNNRISLLATAFPDANRLFISPVRANGSEKWIGFVAAFPHCECVCGLTEKAFTAKYQRWCNKHGYNFSQDKALDSYTSACGHFSVMPKANTTRLLIEQAVFQLWAVSTALAALRNAVSGGIAAGVLHCDGDVRCCDPALGPSLWQRSALCAVSTPRKRWWLSRASTPLRTSPARWKPVAAASPNGVPPLCAEHCSW